jgi:WD40 repeat protein
LGSDPQTATLLVLKALGFQTSSQAEDSLRAALPDVQRLDRWSGPGHEDVTSTAFGPGDRSFVASSQNGTATVVDIPTMWTARVLREPGGSAIALASFSPDGQEGVTSSADGYVRVLSLASGRPILSERVGSAGETVSGVFSPDGTQIVATGHGVATIFDVPSRQVAASLSLSSPVR